MSGGGGEVPRNAGATFVGGKRGPWQVEQIAGIRGAPLPRVSAVDMIPGVESRVPVASVWALRGIIEQEHYTTPTEQARLRLVQPALGRSGCTRAALIPIRKSSDWWDLPLNERRAIFEDRSHHLATGLEYLPAVARQLYHSRRLGEPFDFLTWFEFKPSDSPAFERLVGRLRETEEWNYVEREVDVRLHRADSSRY
ncbi:MAG: chlorite dismutase family protein [Thermoplasmata archaeon]|nr:chlorite dismutase family protein [Thermoplasmata archaeon]